MTTHEIIQNLQQARLELQDSALLEQFWFKDGGSVIATLGTKDGAVSGPVLGYTINGEGSVLIGKECHPPFYKWEHIELRADELVVVCGGKVKRFSVTRPPKRERGLP